MGIGGAEAYVLGRGKPPESRVEHQCVHVDPEQQPAELDLAVAHVGAQLDHARAVDPEPQPGRGEPVLHAERLGGAGREVRCHAAAEQRREGAASRAAGDCHLGSTRRLLGEPTALPVERPDHRREARLGVAVQDCPARLRDLGFRKPRPLA